MIQQRFIPIIWYLFLLAAWIFISSCETDEPSPEQASHFVKFFGSFSQDSGGDVIALDEGYILAGTQSTQLKGKEIFLVKTDRFGNTVWQKNYGETGNDYGISVLQDSQGDLILVGTSADSLNTTNIVLMKVDPAGEVIWERYHNTTSNEIAKAMIMVDDGIIILADTDGSNPGTNNPEGSWDICLMKTDLDGNMMWKSVYGGYLNDRGNDIIKTGNGFMIAGASNSFKIGEQAGINVLLLRINASGGLTDMTTHGGLSDDYGEAIATCKDGFVVCGKSESWASTGSDMFILRVEDEIRNVTWRANFGGPGEDYGQDILVINDEIVAVGSNEVTGGASAMFLKVGLSDGSLLIEENFGTVGSQVFEKVKNTKDNGFICIGSSSFEQNSMIILTKTNRDGRMTN